MYKDISNYLLRTFICMSFYSFICMSLSDVLLLLLSTVLPIALALLFIELEFSLSSVFSLFDAFKLKVKVPCDLCLRDVCVIFGLFIYTRCCENSFACCTHFVTLVEHVGFPSSHTFAIPMAE